MARDPKLWKRNAFVLPGGLLTLYAVAGLLYVAAYRTPSSTCVVAHRFLVGGHCYSAYPFLAALLILGLVLIVVGVYVFRGRPTELPGHLHPGTPTHFVLALLASLVVVPTLVWIILAYVEASQNLRPFSTVLSGYPFQTKFLFLMVAVAGLLALVPFLGLYLAQARLRRTFLTQVDEVAAQEAEAPFPGEPAPRPGDSAPFAPPPEEFVDESLWPESRATEAPAPPPGPAPSAPAASSASSAGPWVPPPAPAKVTAPVTGATKVQPRAPAAATAPVVAVAGGCRAILPTGMECGKTVGPGGRYCLSHACQGRTASGAPCKNPAMEGASHCPAHAVA